MTMFVFDPLAFEVSVLPFASWQLQPIVNAPLAITSMIHSFPPSTRHRMTLDTTRGKITGPVSTQPSFAVERDAAGTVEMADDEGP
jgi:hypothetical protein